MACFDDDIVVIALLFAFKSLFFSTWYTIDFSVRLIYHIFTTYSVFFWAGAVVYVDTAVKVATRPRPEDSDLTSVENLESVTLDTGGINLQAELEVELAKERERADNLQRERDYLEAECRELRSKLQLDVTDNACLDQTVPKLPDNADSMSYSNRTTMAELEVELEHERERADNLQRDMERLEEECRELRSRLQVMETVNQETVPKQRVNQETVPKLKINDEDPEAGSSSGDTADSGAAAHTTNLLYAQHVHFCDGSHPHDGADPHVIATLDWEATFYRDQAETLKGQIDQIQEVNLDLHSQLTVKREQLESALREKTEALQRSLRDNATAIEMERQCQQYLSESLQIRREWGSDIARLEARIQAEEERAGLSQAALRQLQEERKQQDENVLKFVMALESKVEHLLRYLEANQLQEVAQILQKEFNIRLLAVDNGLNFVFETSTQDWARIAEQKIQIQTEIQRQIERLLPEEVRREGLRWQELQECPTDVDIKLCQALPAGITALIQRGQTSASGSDAPVAVSESFVPMTAIPQFSIRTNTESDQDIPNISAVLDDPTSQRVFIADCFHNKIKFASISAPDVVDELVLSEGVWAMAHLRENVIAVTGSRAITLLDITGRPEEMQTVYTTRYYYGIAALDGDTLLVSCCREGINVDDARDEGERPASVDIIKADGQFVSTVIDSEALPELRDPFYLCVIGQEVLISDNGSHCLYRVDLGSGQLLQRLHDPRVRMPCQVCTDGASNVYLACHEGQRVLMVTQGGSGEVTELLTGLRHGEGAARCPCAVGVMGRYLLVSWDDRNRHNSVVKGYQLS